MSRKLKNTETEKSLTADQVLPRLITAKELAHHLATTERNVNRQAIEGTIPCVTFGRSRRFDPREVAEALNLKKHILADQTHPGKS